MIADLKRVKIKIRNTKEREKRFKFHRPVAIVSVCWAPGPDKTDMLSSGLQNSVRLSFGLVRTGEDIARIAP